MIRAFAILALGLCVEIARAQSPGLAIGSKTFTESIVLGEVVRLAAEREGIALEHRRAAGGTRILWRAVLEGEIDGYPEYTGTLALELLHGEDVPPRLDALRAALARRGLGLSAAFGFDNTYALGLPAARADALGLRRISDLVAHPGLRFAFSNEFMDRGDGWPGLRAAYGLPQTAQGMNHDLAYRALAEGAIDLTDLYATDAEIPYYGLRVLEDDRAYFPPYEAVLVYRLDVLQRAPRFAALLEALDGAIDRVEMQRMNAAVKLERREEAAVAADFLGVASDAVRSTLAQRLWRRTLEHLGLVALSLSLAIVLAIPLGVFAARRPRLGRALMGATGLLQTVPALAMFVFMIPLFGIGAAPAIAALFLYSLLPIVRATHVGLVSIAPDLRESAAALGLPRRVRLRRIELPQAQRSILSGIQTAAVINVGTATLGALIGAGGYGQPILTGIRLDDLGLILEGAIPAAALALAVQGVFELVERGLTPRGLRLVARE